MEHPQNPAVHILKKKKKVPSTYGYTDMDLAPCVQAVPGEISKKQGGLSKIS